AAAPVIRRLGRPESPFDHCSPFKTHFEGLTLRRWSLGRVAENTGVAVNSTKLRQERTEVDSTSSLTFRLRSFPKERFCGVCNILRVHLLASGHGETLGP